MEKLPSLNESDLKPWFDKLEMIQRCVEQVQKDLGSFGIVLTTSGDAKNAYQELFTQLEPQLDRLLHRNTTMLQILYKVDVNEDLVRKSIEQGEKISEVLTRLILWRELQKVVTRFLLMNN